MEPDVVVQYLIRGLSLLIGSVVLVTFTTWFVGWLCRRAALPAGITLLAQIAAPVALIYGASIYLDVAGHVVQARVASTEERISYPSGGRRRIPGAWSRSFWATAAFDAPDGPRTAPLWIDETTYDALQPGSPIVVRYLPWLPIIARAADQSTRAFVPWRWVILGVFVLGTVLALRPVLRRATKWLTAVGALAGVAIVFVWVVLPTPWETPLDQPILTAQAEVRNLREVTRSFASGRRRAIRAPQPWNVVELHFVPEGRTKPVIAVDSVDVGSVPGLQVGARLPVTYNVRSPRDARLAGARTWRWREWRELTELAVTFVVVIAGFILLTKAAGAWWRRRMTRP